MNTLDIMVNNTFSCSEIVRIPLLGGVRGGLLIAARCSHQEPTPAHPRRGIETIQRLFAIMSINHRISF